MTRARGPALTVENILPGLMPLVVPLDWVTILPGNPRRGKVEAIARSYKRFGQRKPLVVRITGEVDGHPVGYAEAGNHGLQAMLSMDWKYGAVLWVDESESEAFAFSLADNQTHELGSYDQDDMARMIASLTDVPDLLADAGFGVDDLERIARQTSMGALAQADSLGASSVPEPTEPMGNRGLGTPVVSTSIVFDDSAQQGKWYRFLRFLRDEYPDAGTTGERLALYVDDIIGDE